MFEVVIFAHLTVEIAVIVVVAGVRNN